MLVASVPYQAPHHAASARPAALGLPTPIWLVIWAVLALTLASAFAMPFPTEVDELQHLSVIRAQHEHPALFPDWSSYRVLRADDPTRWSATPNYINHPSLYYLLLSPLMALTGNPLVYRLIDVALSMLALFLVIVAGTRRLAETGTPPLLFAILAASFPKAIVVGGMVNNDNLSALAAACLFVGLTEMAAGPWWLAAGLALAGWSKLTALLALGSVTAVWSVAMYARERRLPPARQMLLILTGFGIGTLPYLVTIARIGRPLWVNEDHWRVPLAAREHLDFTGFTARFAEMFVVKWPAIEGMYWLPLALVGILTPLGLTIAAARQPRERRIAVAYLSGFAVLLSAHFIFGWRSYRSLGDLTTMQTRYYNVLWPGIALAASTAVGRLRSRPAAMAAAVLLCLSPTVLGGVIAVA